MAPAAAPAPVVRVPELRFVSVLFVDLVGFTALSEDRDAGDVRELLARYFRLTRTVVERYGGIVEKYIGDAVMAVWGAPVARENDAERAVRAALEVVGAVARFAGEVGAPRLTARAGVVTGRAAAVDDPGEGIVVGDRVNTAARVQAVAQPGTVLVDEVTRQVTAATIAYLDAGEHRVKGKADPLRLWRAMAGMPGPEPQGAVLAPFVGRRTELRLLIDGLHATVERRAARLVAVTGEAGVGKSRLRREFASHVDGLAETFLWHTGRCLSYGDGVAFWALGEMVRQRFGIPQDAPSAQVAGKLRRGLHEWVPDPVDRAFISPRLGALLGVTQPGLDRAELFAGWRLFLERLAEHEPVILVFEDMQWADRGLLEFIESLLDWSMSLPIFVLTLARADQRGWPAGRRGASTVPIAPLDDGSIRAILSGLVDGLPEGAVARIVERAQGIPLYAVETVRALADRGVLARGDRRLLAVGDAGELDVPASLTALLAARLDALDPAQRHLVRAMSVFGGSFPRDAALALADLAAEQIDGALAALVRRQVLVIRADPLSPERGQYAFAQGLLRTVAYETLTRRERKRRHLAAAEHLTRVFAGDGDEVAEAIAAHYLDAFRASARDGDADAVRRRALTALGRAARRAADVGAPEVAMRSYLTAAELADEDDRPPLLQAAGEMAIEARRMEEAIALLDDAAALWGRSGAERERALVAAPIARALQRLGRNGEAIERLTDALATLGALGAGDVDTARLHAKLGSLFVLGGAPERAAVELEAALRAARAEGLPEVLAEALNDKAILCEFTGRPQEAGALYAAAVEIAERHEMSSTLARSLGNLGFLGMLWDLRDARQHTLAALAAYRRRGDRHAESLAVCNLMQLDLLAGRWDALDALAGELLGEDPDRPGAEYLHYRLVSLRAVRGDPGGAAAALAELRVWDGVDDAELRNCFEACVVIVRSAQGASEEALAHGLAALRSAIGMQGAGADAVRDCWPDTLHAALALARHDQAHGIIALLADRPSASVPPYLRAHLARGRGLLGAAEGRADAVRADLQEALDGFTRLAHPYWRAVTQLDLAAWMIDRGEPGPAAPLLREAHAALATLRAAPALARARALTRTQTPAPAP